MAVEPEVQAVLDPRTCAEAVGLCYVSTEEPGFTRRRSGKGFTYRDGEGRRIADPAVLARIRSLAIPPAWRDVWICPSPDGHLQAVGYDQRGRRQYRYHPRFRSVRDAVKFEHLLAFAEALPALRQRVEQDLQARGLPREKVLATVVRLLEATLARVGNPAYAKENHSYGLTTLRNRHLQIEGPQLRLRFKGKGGKTWDVSVRDRRLARVVRQIQELPGQAIFQYLDEDGRPQTVTSSDVNAYLKAITGRDVTAKDFRTWAATVSAALSLVAIRREAPKALKEHVVQAIKRAAGQLGNTPSICRKCYVHPDVVTAYLEDTLDIRHGAPTAQSVAGLDPEEAAVLGFLRGRLGTRA